MKVDKVGYVYNEAEVDGVTGQVPTFSGSTTDAKVDGKGMLYREQEVDGVVGKMPVVSILRNSSTPIEEAESLAEAFDIHNTSATAHSDIRKAITDATKTAVDLPKYDENTFTLSFKSRQGEELTVNLPIEQLVANLDYDAQAKELVLEKHDGAEIRISIADLVDEYTGTTGEHIQLTVQAGNKLSATLLGGSIDADKLASSLAEKISTAYHHTQAAHAPINAERNAIVGVQRNGIDLAADASRKVNLSVPTKTSELANDSGFIADIPDATTTLKGKATLGAAGGAARFGQPADVGLDKVDNTPDAEKNVASAVQLQKKDPTGDIHTWLTKGASGLFYTNAYNQENAPASDWWYYIGQSHGNANGYFHITAYPLSHPDSPVYTKSCIAGVWSQWKSIADGGNADTLNGMHAAEIADAINVGGVNLLSNTNTFTGWSHSGSVTIQPATYLGLTVARQLGTWSRIMQTYSFKAGVSYTLSAYVRSTTGKTTLYASVPYGSKELQKNLSTEWQRVSHTFTPSEDIATFACFVIPVDASSTGELQVCGYKLEHGNKATDWTPALEDPIDADTAKKLSAPVSLNGVPFDGSKNVAIPLRSFMCGSSVAPGANIWYKVASKTLTQTSEVVGLVLQVNKTVPLANGETATGVLKLSYLSGNPLTAPGKATLAWQSLAGSIDPDDFVLAYSLGSTSNTVELWVKENVQYRYVSFTILSEHGGSAEVANEWSLYHKPTGVSSLPAGLSMVPSVNESVAGMVRNYANSVQHNLNELPRASQSLQFYNYRWGNTQNGAPSNSSGSLLTFTSLDALFQSQLAVELGGACNDMMFYRTMKNPNEFNAWKTVATYEEGTWTPTLFGSTVAGVASYAVRLGTYTRINSQVTIHCRLDGTFTTKPQGQPRIVKLPFPVRADGQFPTASIRVGYMPNIPPEAWLESENIGLTKSTSTGFANVIFGTDISNTQFSIRLTATYSI